MNLLKQIAYYILPEVALWGFRKVTEYIDKKKEDYAKNNEKKRNARSEPRERKGSTSESKRD